MPPSAPPQADSHASTYELSLAALVALLQRVGERDWQPRLAQELERWRRSTAEQAGTRADTSVDRLDNLRLAREQGHFLTDAQEPWANSALAALRHVCWTAHREPRRTWTAEALARELEGRSGKATTVEAVRCGVCGYNQVRQGEIEAAIAGPLVRRAVAELNRIDAIEALLDAVLRMDLPGAADERARVTYLLESAGAAVDKRTDAVQRCPRCKGFGLRRARWQLAEDGTTRCTW